jgi:hypothetical protein
MTELEQLKQIVFNGGFDADSKNDILQLEEQLHELSIAENIKQYPTIQKFIEHLTVESERCTYLLGNDRKLTDLERQVLFEKRDICQKFTYLFDGSLKQSVEANIKHLLDVAKNQSSI